VTGDQTIATVALAVAMVSIIIAVLACMANWRSASAADRSAASSERAEHSAHRAAEAAERSAHDSARLTTMQIEERHEALRPHLPPALSTFTITDPNRPGRHMVKAPLLLEPGEGPPRDYRITVTGHTLNSTTMITSSPTVRPGKTEELFLGSVETGEQLRIVRLALRFWPNTPGAGSEELGTWSCPCGIDDREDGHWRSVVDIDFRPAPSDGGATVVDWDEGYTF
jgi:hypothetical protein